MPVDDVVWEKLTANIEEKLDKAQSSMVNLPSDKIREMRIRCKHDLFYLSSAILGYNKLSTNLHGDLCTWLKQTEKSRFREVLLPRGHYKSTIVTQAHTIQIVLPDDLGDCPWPQNLGPNCRVLIAHETQEMASGFLYAITQQFTSNPLLMGLFPECVPNPKFQRINKSQLDLPRSQIWAEPTIDTMGVGARSQGRHYNYMKLDDLIGDKARDSKVEMQGAKEWFNNIQSFFSDFKNDKLDVIGTRWAVDDLYAHINEMYGPKIEIYTRAVEEYNPVTKKKESIFPEVFPLEELATLRKDKKVFNAQYLNDPKEGNVRFQEDWKRYFFWNATEEQIKRGDARQIHLAKKNRKDDEFIDIADCEKLIFLDPAGETGNTGIVVTATDWRNPYRVFVLETIQKSFSTTSFVSTVFYLVKKWNPRLVIIEEVNFSKVYQDLFKVNMTIRGQTFRMFGQKTGQKQKEARVEVLSTWFSDNRIFFNESQRELIYQFDNFGAIKDYHLLDVLAYGPLHWRTSKRASQMEEDEDMEMAKAHNRSPLTGYSTIEYEGAY